MTRHQHRARGIAVKAVDKARAKDLAALFKMKGERVGKRIAKMSVRGVGGHAVGLVEHHPIGALGKDRQRQVAWLNMGGGLAILNGKLEQIARAHRGANRHVAMTRYIKRGGQVWIKIFPDKPITEKPAETRMGSGKGSPEYWVAVVKPGRVMFEMAGVAEDVAREAMRLAGHKLPIKTKFMKKEENGEG